jgi:hypothetical protein
LSKNVKIRIYRAIILYACETLSITVREEHRLRVFENKVLRRISGSKREKVTRDWRKLRSEELYNLYPSPNAFRMMNSRNARLAGHVTLVGRREMRIQFWRESQMEIDQ